MSELPPDPSALHFLWDLVLTAAGGILAYFFKRAVDQIDKKVDLDTYAADKIAMNERQMERHEANTERLDRIEDRLDQVLTELRRH